VIVNAQPKLNFGSGHLEPATTRPLRLTPVCGRLTAYHI